MQYQPDWEERMALAAKWIPEYSIVVDFGAGSGKLLNYLPKRCSYTPLDKLDLNFNIDSLPNICNDATIGVCLGLLEWLDNPKEFLSKMIADTLIVSYAIFGLDHNLEPRVENGWKNHFRLAELMEIFRDIGYNIEEFTWWKDQILFKLERKK
jgi:hypothetical protein